MPDLIAAEGMTPARAETTHTSGSVAGWLSDDPRSRGDDFFLRSDASAIRG